MCNLSEMAEGRIQKALSGFYYVDTGKEVLTCRARGKFRKEGITPLVGDRVEVRELGGGEGFVEKILPRKNVFTRPAVANIDQLVVIASGAVPRTDPFLIDRVAAIAALRACEVIVVLNKCDLDPAEELYAIYRAAGFQTLRVSAETGEGTEALKACIAGKVSAFTGNSGVGKSSILNALDPTFHIQVGEVSDALGRGRHTTRHVELFRLSCGAEVMDSPGFSSFETAELDLGAEASPAGDVPGVRALSGAVPVRRVQPYPGEGLRCAGGAAPRRDPKRAATPATCGCMRN